MTKILGLDTGTNSLGWAIVQRDDNGSCTLLEHGTNIFQDGVNHTQSGEASRAAERTKFRQTRKHYWRRKVRKIALLRLLIDHHLCPPLDREALTQWRKQKQYPDDELFLAWQKTEDKEQCNPYHYRHICLTQQLDLSDPTQRYILGRAIYHINQRRGFLSNRKVTTTEADGKVQTGIDELSQQMAEYGCQYLGEYFYHLYQKGEKIRAHYTHRIEHYEKELLAICAKQGLDKELTEKLRKTIITQRPLKSQKHTVGKCTFEPKKARCPISHPAYEEFRMYNFLNNIRVRIGDAAERPLTAEEKQLAIPNFYRATRKFSFEEIRKKIEKGGAHGNKQAAAVYHFNYDDDCDVSTCEVTRALRSVFGEDWQHSICETYTLAKDKSQAKIVNDVWHVLFSFDDDEKIKQFGIERLQLSEEQADKLAKIRLPQGYASLSLKAINNILPYMRDYGLIYSEAVFMAALYKVIPADMWQDEAEREGIILECIEVLHREKPKDKEKSREQQDEAKMHRLKEHLVFYNYAEPATLEKLLYHPSMINLYPQQQRKPQGYYQLGSPRIEAVRNPMAMHSLFRLRKVINLLLQQGKIDQDTVINIEFSRDLNDANRRKAIQAYQRDLEKENKRCRDEIKKFYKDCGIDREPSDTDVLKYRLWEEQSNICLYTGATIGLTDFLGDNPRYDIEHTIPRSKGGDTTLANLTLCDSKFNRQTKKNQLPSELACHEAILERVAFLKDKWRQLDWQIKKNKQSTPADKEAKDKHIQHRHRLLLERDYYRGKFERFTMTEVPKGFARRQGTDNSVISRYARMYLKSVFKHVYIVKAIATSDFRKIWGLQEAFTKKERDNHVHHCIDAITIGCIGKMEYDQLARYYHQLEEHEWYGKSKPHFEKPWPTFVEDVKQIQDTLLVAHYSQDNMLKSARRRIKIGKQKVSCDVGDVARGSLHKDSFYGAIEREDVIRYVIRKELASVKPENVNSVVNNIVDEVVKSKVNAAIAQHGTLAKALEAGIWMNREKGISIKKVRIFFTKEPMPLHKHRDASRHDYKRDYYVMNDGNYMLGIYIGHNAKGKEIRKFEEINMLDAARLYRTSHREEMGDSILPPTKDGCKLAYQLKIGTMVLLYENTPDEVWADDAKGLQKRLYKIISMSLSDGRMVLLHHQVAAQSSDVKMTDGAFKNADEFRPKMRISMNQFKALVIGVDFSLNDIGQIERIK